MKHCTRRDVIARLGLAGLAALALQPAATIPTRAADTGKIEITSAWARPSIGGIPRSVAYLTIANTGRADDRLLEVTGAVSDKVELHNTIMDGDIMRMRPVEDGVAVPAGDTVTFGPAGLHVMLIGLKKPLKEGKRFPLTLLFEKAGKIKAEVAVSKNAPGGGMHHKQ